jgi:CO/xanthine dehydrogenase Mo-binding subunit
MGAPEGSRAQAGGTTVTNAIADAVDAPGRADRLHEVPATPERIVDALR